jgi:lipopolysaccharide export LptBFGC system permease protein LptF
MDEPFWVGVLIVAIIFFSGIAAWIGEEYRKWQKYKAKQQASQQVDGTDWLVYDKRAEIKQLGHELRNITRKRGGRKDEKEN